MKAVPDYRPNVLVALRARVDPGPPARFHKPVTDVLWWRDDWPPEHPEMRTATDALALADSDRAPAPNPELLADLAAWLDGALATRLPTDLKNPELLAGLVAADLHLTKGTRP